MHPEMMNKNDTKHKRLTPEGPAVPCVCKAACHIASPVICSKMMESWQSLVEFVSTEAASGAGFPFGCFSNKISCVFCCKASSFCLLSMGIRLSKDRTPLFSLWESSRRAAYTLLCSINRLKIRAVFSRSNIRVLDEARCFCMHVPSWRRTSNVTILPQL